MNEDRVIQKLMEHDERLDRMEKTMSTKSDVQEIKSILEMLVTSVKKIQDDHTFIVELFKRLQNEIDSQKSDLRKQDEEIRKIKMQLKMA